MSFQEKSNAVMLGILGLVYAGYTFVIVRWAVDTPVAEMTWQPLMILTVVPVTLLAAATHIYLAMRSPNDADEYDERDRLIDLRGEWLGGIVLAVGVFAGIVLAMFETDPFWVAHVLLGALVLAEITKDARTLVLYRRGI